MAIGRDVESRHACPHAVDGDEGFIWTTRGVQGLRANAAFEKYGCPEPGSKVPAIVQSDRIWPAMLCQQWVAHCQAAQNHLQSEGIAGPSPTANLASRDGHTIDPTRSLSLIIREWMDRNPGCLVEVHEQARPSHSTLLSTEVLVYGLLQELNPFELDPWGAEGVNQTLQLMRSKKVLFAVHTRSMWEKGVQFFSPQTHALGEAASEACNQRLANFISQTRSDGNVRRIFSKFLLPGSRINSSEWHQDQGSEDQQTWARCLVYLNSGHGGDDRPLHYIGFRLADQSGIDVRIGFPSALAMSGPLRCGAVVIDGEKVCFEHRGEPPLGTACCFALDIADMGKFSDDYRGFAQAVTRSVAQVIIPDDLCTSHCYRIIGDKIEFMDAADHEDWLVQSGMREYWQQGGEVFKRKPLISCQESVQEHRGFASLLWSLWRRAADAPRRLRLACLRAWKHGIP